MEKLFWKDVNVPEELRPLLETIAEDYPVKHDGKKGTELVFEKKTNPNAAEYVLSSKKGLCRIVYSTIPAASRALASALAGHESDKGTTPFRTFGVMLDCSRNGVMTVEHLKVWLRRMSLLGCSMLMLYTEDTYELPGEPFFGYQRGRYTMDELHEIDDYASMLGIEVVGCIQTLGHLAQALKWRCAYGEISDTGDILLADCDKTYELIGKMAAFWSRALRSRRIHIGMDEAHSLGRGRYTDIRNGENVNVFELFNRHFGRVMEIFKKQGLSTMIWSDMYFRLSNPKKEYYCLDCEVPEEVAKKIPRDAGLVYWDYYNTSSSFYKEFIERHRKLGFEPLMASGIWTWMNCWYDHYQTQIALKPCLEACLNKKVKELVFTMWGDNGDTCCMDSALGGLAIASDMAFGAKETDEKRFETIFGSKLKHLLSASKLDMHTESDKEKKLIHIRATSLLWEDPLLQIVSNAIRTKCTGFAGQYAKNCAEIVRSLRNAKQGSCGDFGFASGLASYLGAKTLLLEKLRTAYLNGNRKKLRAIAEKDLPELIEKCVLLTESYRREWTETFKPFGFEVIQIRLAGQKARLEEASLRIEEYLDGKVSSIPELANSEPVGDPNSTFWYSYAATACGAV